MTQYIALLRGINVGGHRIKMDRLREVFDELGHTNVSTFIASGNVIFSAESTDVESLTSEIEHHLAGSLGYDVPTFLRTLPQLEAIAAVAPAGVDSQSFSLYVIFLHAPAGEDLRASLSDLGSAMDEFRFSGREIYWLIQGKLTDSPLFGKGIEKALRGVPSTSRNVTTVRRLITKMAG